MQSSLNRSYKHPTYGNKPTPSLQLLAQLSKFDGKRKESIADVAELVKLQEQDNSYRGTVEESQQRYINSQDTRQTVIPSKSNASNATTLLDPTFRTDDSKEMSLKAAQTRHHYTYNSHMNASVGKLLYSKGEGLPTELNMPTKRMANPTVSNMDNSLIGGLPAGDDAWVTTAQLSSNGEALEQKKPHGKKVVHSFNPELFVSPITGEPIADYGDWVEDRKTGKPGNNSNNSAEDDLKALQKSDPVMYKLKTQLALRGAKGSIGLSRVFRIMDDDGSRSLSFSEFKKAMQEFGMALNDTELVILFKRFDTQQSGSISYEQFLRTIAGTLNARRRQLVQQAFDIKAELKSRGSAGFVGLQRRFKIMDDDGNRSLDLSEFKKAMKEMRIIVADSDMRMLFEHFDADGSEGGISSTSNMAVLVTDSSGVERRVILENDLGVKPNDTSQIYARLRSQGVGDIRAINGKIIKVLNINGVDVVTTQGEVTSQINNSKGSSRPPPLVQRAPPAQRPQSASSMAILNRQQQRLAPTPTSTTRPIAQPLDPSVPSSSSSLKTNQAQFANKILNRMQTDDAQKNKVVENQIVGSTLLDVLRSNLLSKGPTGIIDLQRKFIELDVDNSKALDLSEFKVALSKCGIPFSDAQAQSLFTFLDKDSNGGIDYQELLNGLRGPFNPTLLSQQQEQAGRNSDSGGKVLGRIKEAQEFSEEYWGVGNNQNAGVSRPTTSSGYQGRLSYQSTSAAQPSVLVTPRGDQGFASRPKSASGGGSIRRTTNLLQQQANNPATKSAMEEKIRLTQRQAILLFNQNNFEEALSYFEESLKLLQMIYPSNHPECIKAEKSILLTQRKMETL
eukprot:gene2309-2530_t